MNVPTLRDRLIEKLNYLSDKQLESIWQFVEKIENQSQKVNIVDRRKDLLTKFDNLCQETQVLHADNPLTDEEIQAEIDAYRGSRSCIS